MHLPHRPGVRVSVHNVWLKQRWEHRHCGGAQYQAPIILYYKKNSLRHNDKIALIHWLSLPFMLMLSPIQCNPPNQSNVAPQARLVERELWRPSSVHSCHTLRICWLIPSGQKQRCRAAKNRNSKRPKQEMPSGRKQKIWKPWPKHSECNCQYCQ